MCYKERRFYWSTLSDKGKKIYHYHGFSMNNSDMSTWFMEQQHFISFCSVYWCVWIPSILYFTCLNSFCAFFLMLYWSNPVSIPMSTMLELLTSCFFIRFLNSWDDNPGRYIIFNNHICAYNILLKMGMIWWKKLPPFCLLKIFTYKTNFSLFRKKLVH